MDQGNEGDEIILLALRQIDAPIGEEITSVGQLTPELIVDIVARCLWLMSEGELKFSPRLPPNVATRHRLCTDMASKVKSFGFTGDCGYNQLLYPVENQTRTLMTWLVQRLPRTEDDRTEEVLGANALLNKRILSSLSTWKLPWRLSCCAKGSPLSNVYVSNSLRTFEESSTKQTFEKCSAMSTAPESSIFEKHTVQIVADKLYESRLEKGFDDDSEGMNSAARDRERREQMQTMLRNALSSAKSQYSMARQAGSFGAGSALAKQSELLSMSLNDVIASMSDMAGGSSSTAGSGSSSSHRGTRFMHAAEFAEEINVNIGGGTSSSSRRSKAEGLAAAAAGMDAEEQLSAKERQEAEEKARAEEIDALRADLLNRQSAMEAFERREQNMASKVRQLESELEALQNESESLEREVMLKRKTLEMLPSATENIGKLQAICSASGKRMLQLAQEWETHRRPLVDKLRAIKKTKSQRKLRCRMMVDEIKKLREDMVRMVEDLKEKQERVQLLLDEKSKLPKNINRLIYTHRIMDIIASIAKQNKDVDKITSDIRDIQKTINTTTSSLQRADALCEELIYGAANGPGSERAMVDTYRRLRALRVNFDNLIDTVTRIGQQEKLGRDLETKIDQETTRVSANNIDRIVSDLQQVQNENAQLLAQIKAKTRK